MNELNLYFKKFTDMQLWFPLVETTAKILFIFFLMYFVLKFLDGIFARLEAHWADHAKEKGDLDFEAEKRAETLAKLVKNTLTIVLWLITTLLILKELGIDIGPILASAGVVGVAVGFGAQNLIKDIIAGFFFILENQVRVGDVAVVNGTAGLVERLNFRTIVLRDLEGVVHIFPNGSVTTLANMTQKWSACVLDIRVSYKEDVDHVMNVMKKVAAIMRQDAEFGPLMIADMEMFGLDQVIENALIIKARIRTRPMRQWDVAREYRRRLKYAFDAEKIEIPFPHVAFHQTDERSLQLESFTKTDAMEDG